MPTILTLNSGSSSVKASLFEADGTRRDFFYGHLRDPRSGFDQLMRDLHGHAPTIVGHRFVHGGDISDAARLVDEAELARLRTLVPLAPLHLPGNLLGIELCRERFSVPQVACFDTAFHATLPPLASRLPIPAACGMRRYGFHGLNYAHVASVLPEILGDTARGKVVVAHLGSGASLCLLDYLKSRDTSMGYTPAGGIVMGTRSGDLDPGVMLALAQRHDAETLRDIVFHQMGLLALSGGESSEMRDLLASDSDAAKFAVNYFCRQVSGAIGNFSAKAGGIDALVFTAGIGEHSARVRAKICGTLGFMGIRLDPAANQAHAARIDSAGTIPVCIVPADEESMIRQLCLQQ
ncbi:acetate/propionate family kinase [Ferrigenium sp. UT4]